LENLPALPQARNQGQIGKSAPTLQPFVQKFDGSFIFHIPFLICHWSLVERAATTMKDGKWKMENGK
jgi:hypothetical protein